MAQEIDWTENSEVDYKNTLSSLSVVVSSAALALLFLPHYQQQETLSSRHVRPLLPSCYPLKLLHVGPASWVVPFAWSQLPYIMKSLYQAAQTRQGAQRPIVTIEFAISFGWHN